MSKTYKKMLYYPGCTMKADRSNGTGFEESGLAVTSALGVDLIEMEKWYCCGTMYSLTSDNLIRQLGPIRNLVKVQSAGENKVVTMCSMCWNTIACANDMVRKDEEKLNTINEFMDTEENYDGNVEILYLLQLIHGQIGLDRLRKSVKKPLKGLTVVPYYGCVMTRPKNIAVDKPDYPRMMHDVLEALGATVVTTEYQDECCGSYHTVGNKEIVGERAFQILGSVQREKADAIVLTCPLCQFNLDARQEETKKLHPKFTNLPVFYFTQLIAIALGLDPEVCHFENHEVDPIPLLESKGFLKEIVVEQKK